MYLKHNKSRISLYEAIRQDKKVYKNSLVNGIVASKEYQAYIGIKALRDTVIQPMWLDYMDKLTWEELIAIDRQEWIDNKMIELGLQ